jgi:hypothetical protein
MEIGELILQLNVIVRGACNIAGAAGTGANPVDGFVHRRNHGGMLAHAKVVVGAPNGDGLDRFALENVTSRKRAAAALYVREGAVTALGMELAKAFTKSFSYARHHLTGIFLTGLR